MWRMLSTAVTLANPCSSGHSPFFGTPFQARVVVYSQKSTQYWQDCQQCLIHHFNKLPVQGEKLSQGTLHLWCGSVMCEG